MQSAVTRRIRSRAVNFPVSIPGGIIIGIENILYKERLGYENKDASHPHGIERLYSLLDFWGISDDSYYWKLAYKILCKWCKNNNMTIDWEKKTSNTYKEKYFDAYIHFKKEPQ